ncbi:chorion transcription factor Cf2-like [Planococcus citri]|uniref:chorion transcription factor Cf2-like n=1 Tax=Planococcus citri TaxID=170843 RepID=UPI0031F7A819
MLQNMLCVAMRKKVENLIHEFDNLLRGYQILRGNVRENEVPLMGHASISVSDFHSLLTSFQTLLENTCEKDFLNYVRNEDDVRSKYIEMSNEHENLKTAYQTATQNVTELDSRLKETVSERDELIRMFDELKQMSEKGSFQKLPSVPRNRIKSMIESVQKLTDKRLPSYQHLNTSSNNEQTEFQAEQNHSLLPYFCDTSSTECFKTEVFVPGSPRIQSPELLIPDSIDEHREDVENVVSDQVSVSGDVQVITVTWDEVTDKSSDEVFNLNDDHENPNSTDGMDSSPDIDPIESQPTLTEEQDPFALDVNNSSRSQEFRCDICYRSYSRRDSLSRHKKIHTETKVYLCTYCPSKFRQHSHLLRHENTHSNLRTFLCPICNRGFNHRDNRERHMKNHAAKNSYMCAHCKKNYRSKLNLKMHISSKACLLV